MPTLRTIISDLYHQRSNGVVGVGLLGSRSPLETRTLSSFFRVEENATPITVSFDGAPDHMARVTAATPGAANGSCLFFHDEWSTVATLNRARRIVLGGGYSGCLYSVYSTGTGEYKCVHTARPKGPMSDAFVGGIRAYAAEQHWTLVHEVPTVGGVGVGGCVTTFMATRVSYTINPTPVVRTVRLRQNAQGFSVGQDRFETPSA